MPKANVSFFLPAPELRRSISTYYIVEAPKGADAVSDLLHPEWANIRLVLDGEWEISGKRTDVESEPVIFGPSSRAKPIRGQGGSGFGIGLLPRGWAALTNFPAAGLADGDAPAAEVLGEDAGMVLRGLRFCTSHAERASRLDTFFLARKPTPEAPPLALIDQAHLALMNPEVATVEAFASILGLSVRQSHRLSCRAFGFPPRLLLSRQRFLRTLAVLRQNLDRPWADLIDARYYDQSHLVRDFNRFMGMSPTAYFELRRDMLEPAAIARTATVGQSLQGLQPPAARLSDSSNPADRFGP